MAAFAASALRLLRGVSMLDMERPEKEEVFLIEGDILIMS